MKLLTKDIRTKLERNHALRVETGHDNHLPVVKLFNPVGAGTWLLTEIEPDGDTAFGLCDLGVGFPELGSVSISELEGIALPLGLTIERDRYFEADKTLTQYMAEATTNGYLEA